jgi:hypothetical protein
MAKIGKTKVYRPKPSHLAEDGDINVEPDINKDESKILWWRKVRRIGITVKSAAKEAADLLDINSKEYSIKETKNYISLHFKNTDFQKIKYMNAIISHEVDLKNRHSEEADEARSSKSIKRIESKVDTCYAEVEQIKNLYSDIKPMLESISDLE